MNNALFPLAGILLIITSFNCNEGEIKPATNVVSTEILPPNPKQELLCRHPWIEKFFIVRKQSASNSHDWLIDTIYAEKEYEILLFKMDGTSVGSKHKKNENTSKIECISVGESKWHINKKGDRLYFFSLNDTDIKNPEEQIRPSVIHKLTYDTLILGFGEHETSIKTFFISIKSDTTFSKLSFKK